MWAITGGNGFIGKTLKNLLMETGRKTRVLCRNIPEVLESDKLIEYFRADLITVSPALLTDFLKDVNVLFHLVDFPSRKLEDASFLNDLHVEGTRKLLAAARVSGVKRVLMLSTSGTVGVFDNAEYTANENYAYSERIAGRWPYFASKIEQEKLALRWARETDTEFISIRPSMILGPGDEKNLHAIDIVKFLNKEIPYIPSGGLSFVDVRDVADAFFRAAEVKLKDLRYMPRTYLLGATNWTFRKFFNELEKISGVHGPFIPAGRSVSTWLSRFWSSPVNILNRIYEADPVSVEMANYYWYIDSSLALKELDLQLHEPAETLQDTVNYIRGTYR